MLKIETDDLLKLNAFEVIDLIRKQKISALDYSKKSAEHIGRFEKDIHAFAFFDPSLMFEQARSIDRLLSENVEIDPQDGIRPHILYGLPVGIKDVFNTEKMPTGMGSPLWDGFSPGNDARVVTRIKRAGGLVAGKTVTAEFAVHHPGPTVNPHGYEYSPGTSSSGSAAAVASFMLPLSIGTQTAGSTIRPASYCGIFGFKPSFGLISRTGVLKTLDTLDHVTMFGRHPKDLDLLFNVMRVYGKNYPFIEKNLTPDFHDQSKKTYKIGFVKPHTWSHTESYVKEAIEKLARRISDLPGIVIEEVELPEAVKEAHEIHTTVYEKALSYYFKEEYAKAPDKISPVMAEMISRGQKISLETYQAYVQKQVRLRHIMDTFFELSGLDLLLCNSTAAIAPFGLHGREKPDPCLIWTLCGIPSINMPYFNGPADMPFGAQFVARRFRDYTLLRFADHLWNLLKP